jgi:hypothetical protein
MSASISNTMLACLYQIEAHGGKLVRLPGGFWSWPDCPRHAHDGVPHVYWGTSTVQALVARKELEYVDWRDGRGGRFPIAAARPSAGKPS